MGKKIDEIKFLKIYIPTYCNALVCILGMYL